MLDDGAEGSGGDTLFVSMYKAYESLPEDVKRQLVGLRAVHSSRHAFGAASAAARSAARAGAQTHNPELATQDFFFFRGVILIDCVW